MNTSAIVENILSHHGIKGMRWGVRSRSTGPRSITVKDRRKKIKTSGGRGHPAHPEAVRAHTIGQKAKKSGLKSLSNEELQAYQQRLNLETNIKRLTISSQSESRKFVTGVLKQTGSQVIKQAANDAASHQVKKILKK